jgi:hypothetical protein
MMGDSKKCAKNAALLFILPIALMVCGGCATPFRAHPDFHNRYRTPDAIVLMEPDIAVYELTTGEGLSFERLRSLSQGVRESKTDWSKMAVENVKKAVAEAYEQKGIRVLQMPAAEGSDDERKEIRALFRAVSDSIILHAYKERASMRENQGRNVPYADARDMLFNQTLEPYPFPEKQENFRYGVGSVENILKKYNGQALVLVTGMDEISTNERKALIAAGILIEQLPLPVGVPGLPQAGKTNVSIALIDRSGDVLFYSSKGDLRTDLLNRDNARKFMRDILSDFPEFKR